MDYPPTRKDPHDRKARYLREVFRALAPATRVSPGEMLIVDKGGQAEAWAVVAAEYEALFGEPSSAGALERILSTCCSEEGEPSASSAEQQLGKRLRRPG